MDIILVQLSNRSWTMPAVHLACALARNTHAKVILLQLIAVDHPIHLGTGSASALPTADEQAAVENYAATAEDYGIEMTLQPMYYSTVLDAVVQAANDVNADAVFAHVPDSRIPLWHRFRTWMLERRLAASHRQLFVIERPDQTVDRLPSITVKPVYSLISK
jgi:hypothetical protein